MEKTKNLITKILKQAQYDIKSIKTNPEFSSVLKFQRELQKEIDENANSIVLDPKTPK